MSKVLAWATDSIIYWDIEEKVKNRFIEGDQVVFDILFVKWLWGMQVEISSRQLSVEVRRGQSRAYKCKNH